MQGTSGQPFPVFHGLRRITNGVIGHGAADLNWETAYVAGCDGDGSGLRTKRPRGATRSSWTSQNVSNIVASRSQRLPNEAHEAGR